MQGFLQFSGIFPLTNTADVQPLLSTHPLELAGDPKRARQQLHTGVLPLPQRFILPPCTKERAGCAPQHARNCHPALQSGTSKARLRQGLLAGDANVGEYPRLTASRGQNAMKHSQVSNISDVLCLLPARTVSQSPSHP